MASIIWYKKKNYLRRRIERVVLYIIFSEPFFIQVFFFVYYFVLLLTKYFFSWNWSDSSWKYPRVYRDLISSISWLTSTWIKFHSAVASREQKITCLASLSQQQWQGQLTFTSFVPILMRKYVAESAIDQHKYRRRHTKNQTLWHFTYLCATSLSSSSWS